MVIDLDKPITQQAFGELVGISQQAVSELVRAGVLLEGGTCREWLHAYMGRLREQAAGRLGSELGGLDLVQERAALAREQRIGIELRNARERGEYASITLLAQVLASASQAVAERFDHLPGDLRKRCPDMTDAQRDEVVASIVAARNEWTRSTAELVAAELEDDEADLFELADHEPRAD
jgi:phage terminase Nu1 subunit (DNA packaging protein)